MSRKAKGAGLLVAGVIVFIISFFVLLPIQELYIVSLVAMFGGVVLVGVGGAMAKGIDRSLDTSAIECYFCKGTGKVPGVKGPETCPRCGGTGKGRSDD
ncbi:MAG: hypothetical protein C4K47_04480 [Candidatus Thorarchaeota archaeon]|nr:MAG: hypothetical protein C4K47_04480 [Candidatus Thorarchaeota archaeon]